MGARCSRLNGSGMRARCAVFYTGGVCGCSAAPHGLLSVWLISLFAGRPVTEEPEGTMEEKHYKRIINQVRRAGP